MIRHLLLPLFSHRLPRTRRQWISLVHLWWYYRFRGTAGGGITPWAFIGGYASKEEVSYSANIQYLT